MFYPDFIKFWKIIYLKPRELLGYYFFKKGLIGPKVSEVDRKAIGRVYKKKIDAIQSNKKTFMGYSLLLYSKIILLPMILIEARTIRVGSTNLVRIIELARLLSSFNNTTSEEFKSYFTFTRFSDGIDRYACDYCSLVIGFLELICHKTLDAAQKRDFNVNLLMMPTSMIMFGNKFNTLTRKTLPGFLKIKNQGSASLIQMKPYEDALKNNNLSNSDKQVFTDFVHELIKIKNIVEIVESRYCPFKHLKEINFDKPYYFFNADNIEELKQAQNILSKKGVIKCDECVETLNDSSIFKDRPQSIFNNFIVYLEDIALGKAK
tara:strand:+ start:1997 stop:2956 length:960 start_codon:yes stop_codon:yes gene_type:complete